MVFVLLPLIAVAIVYVFLNRGRKAVRAFFYILGRNAGESVFDANRGAMRIGFHRASQHNLAMIDCANKHFGGSQLRLIGAARQDGFTQ
ncbi:hypothetical protein ACFQAT_28315 [Undibacterium arcticum]|uniref:Uncharacterized protein n=1 Tax=Undibacterium arcticum TaxID=1762892 RepID=A0ABV7F9W6_9BURK